MCEDTKIQWAEVKPGYRVGSDGSIWSDWKRVGLGRGRGATAKRFGEWRRLLASPDTRGYPKVTLGRGDPRYVHALVLTAFVGPMPEGMVCRHLDGDKQNNSLDNLAWGTQAENMRDQYIHGTRAMGQRHGAARLTTREIEEIRSLAGVVTQDSIATKFGVSQGWVSQVVNRRTRANG